MRHTAIAIGIVLAVAAGANADPKAPQHPLDGQRFLSVEKLSGGDRRDGTINKIQWELNFKETEFTWRHSDVISMGSFTYDGKTGALTVKAGAAKIEASFDPKTGVLTWDKKKYKAANPAK